MTDSPLHSPTPNPKSQCFLLQPQNPWQRKFAWQLDQHQTQHPKRGQSNTAQNKTAHCCVGQRTSKQWRRQQNHFSGNTANKHQESIASLAWPQNLSWSWKNHGKTMPPPLITTRWVQYLNQSRKQELHLAHAQIWRRPAPSTPSPTGITPKLRIQIQTSHDPWAHLQTPPQLDQH